MGYTETIHRAVEKHRRLILDALDHIWHHPETGYREWNTMRYLAQRYEQLGYRLTYAGDIPGFYTVVDTGRPGPEILILGELDSLINTGHPDADPVTGAAHCCGHAVQSACLLGVAAALQEEGVLDGLCGRIRLCAVPAEEMIELDYRSELKKQGIIEFYGGKQEFLRRGYFDGVDMAFLVHTGYSDSYSAQRGAVGFIGKRITYHGVSAHGRKPEQGRNALYAATLGLQAINSVRETFPEQDIVRVHPIITKGGEAVNAIPGEVQIETYVRGASFDAIMRVNRQVDRALAAGAAAMGNRLTVADVPGYAPYQNDRGLLALAKEALHEIAPEQKFAFQDEMDGDSTDLGDLAQIMPIVHPQTAGMTGTAHSVDYRVKDPELACIVTVKWEVAILRRLLENDAASAKEVLAASHPPFASKDA